MYIRRVHTCIPGSDRTGFDGGSVKSACVSVLPVIYSLEYGALAQLVVRYIRIVEARGSTPLCSTSRVQVFLDPFLNIEFGKSGI